MIRQTRHRAPTESISAHWQEREAAMQARIGSASLKNAILAVFPYGHGELPSVANSTFKRMPPPTLISRGEAMS